MSAALSVFKLSVQSIRQLQQHKIAVSFKIIGLPCSVLLSQIIPYILKQGSLQLDNVGWFWRSVLVLHLTW